MFVAWSRSVLLVSVLGVVAALVVALLMGAPSQADDHPAAVVPVFSAPVSGADVASLRTEDSRTYRRADGSYTAQISAQPVNFQDAAGAWQPIDTDLKSDGAGGLVTTAAATEVALPPSLEDPAKVSAGGRWVSFALQGSAAVAPTAAGATATYADALDGVDAAYTAQPAGVKETLTLADGSAPATYRFALDASSGLTPSLRDGAVVFRDGDGSIRFSIPAPTVQEAGASSASSQHVSYELSAGGQSLSVVVDAQWLASASFPVVVDPSVYIGGNNSCALVDGSLASTADCNGSTLKVGHDAGHTYRAAVRFTGLTPDVPQDASITRAELVTYFTGQSASGAVTKVDAVGLGRTLGTGATWSTYDGTHAWTTAGGDLVSDPQPSPLTMYQSYAPGYVTWDVSKLAENWVRDTTTNNGVLLKLHDETASNVLSFNGQGSASGRPSLNIDYEWHPGFERDQTYESVAGVDDRSGVSVNVASGNLAVDSGDIRLPGVAGMDLDVSRTFNAQNLGGRGTIFGSAWSESINGARTINDYLWYDDARVIYANGGAIYRFDRDYAHDTGTVKAYITPSGIDADLTVDRSTDVGTLTYRKTGMKWIYSYNYDGYNVRLSQIQDRHGNTITLNYRTDYPEVLDHITDTYGRALTFTYDFAHAGKLTKITDASGRHWDYTTDTTTSSGHRILTGFTNPDGKTTTYHYDTGALPGTWDKLDKITDARGHDTTLAYGSDGDYSQVTKITRAVDATSAHDVVWQYQYHPAAAVGTACTAAGVIGRTVETDPLGHLTTYCYNNNGQVVQTFDGNGRSVKTTYNAAGNVATFSGLAGTANPSLSTYSFATNGNATGTSTAVGTRTQSSTIKYCGDTSQPPCSGTTGSLDKYRPTLGTDSQGTSQAFGYNAAGDLNDITTASGSDHQSLTYDSVGNVLTSTDGNLRQTTYGYNPAHFLTSVTPPAPLAAESFSPDSLSRVHTATDGDGQTATATYDGEDRVTRVDWSPSGKWMTFTYDATGNVTQRADSDAHTTTYGYDYANRRTSESFPASRTNTYVYDQASNLSSITDGDGTTSYTYDPANRLTSITSPKPTSGTDTITYGYTDPAAATDPSTQTTTYPGGLKQVSTSDAAGNVLSIKILNSSGTVLKSRSYVHELSAAATSALIQSVSDEAGNVTTYTPGSANRLIDAKTKSSGGTTLEDWAYAYDAAGNRTLRTHTVGAGSPVNTSFAYNFANELCWSNPAATTNPCDPTHSTPPTGATTYAYDGAGQRTTGATYDAQQRLTTFGSSSLGYLSPGNGELVSYASTGYQNTILGLSRQIPATGSATDTIRQPNGAAVAQRVGTTSKQELFSDALGSTIAMSDDGANTLSRSYSYDPDGNPATTGTGATTNLLFAGGLQLPNNNYHYGERYYDPTTATWTQQDPLNQISSLTQANHYTYVGGDPINGSDATGLVSCSTFGLGSACKAASQTVKHPLQAASVVDTALDTAAVGSIATLGTAACIGATAGLASAACAGIAFPAGVATAGGAYATYREADELYNED